MLAPDQVHDLLAPYADVSFEVCGTIAQYVDLLMRWNARTNLTAIRDESTLVQRQVGESLFARTFLESNSTLLDFGSGAGFPGIPLAIARPDLRVTLAESQGKKASFLREAVRLLQLGNTDVFSGRVETLAADRLFDTVVMRAVDHSASMLPIAEARVSPQGTLLRYLSAAESAEMHNWHIRQSKAVPLSEGRLVSWIR